MKIKSLILVFLVTIITYSQEEKNNTFFSVQTGFLGVWINNEFNLNDTFVLKSELGLDSGFFGDGINNRTGFILYPNLSLQPKYYYNLNKRASKGLNTGFNSGNFVGLKIKYNPNWFSISNVDNVGIVENISIIPKWGIKRSYFSNLTIELGAGVGYRHYFLNQSNNGEVALDLLLRIGYVFK